MKILITGAAGFIGYHLTNKLIKTKHKIFSVDNFNNYYSVKLKKDRVKDLINQKGKFIFLKSICNKEFVNKIFKKNKFDIVINLAAQAGVRYSLKSRELYKRNIIGYFNILKLAGLTK